MIGVYRFWRDMGYLRADGNNLGSCVVLSTSGFCTTAPNAPIPANSLLTIRSVVAAGTASPADATFSWIAE